MAASQITTRFRASVRSLRHRLGISQEALAEHAGLHRTYITGIEGGSRNVTLKSIEKLARALQVSIPDLFMQANGLGGLAEPAKGNADHGPSHVHALGTRLDTNG